LLLLPGTTPTPPRRRLPRPAKPAAAKTVAAKTGQGCREAEEERRHSQAEEDRGRRRRDQAQGAGEEGRGEAEEVPRGEASCLVSDLKSCLRDGDPR